MQSEKQIQNEIIRELSKYKGIRFWRQNTGGMQIGDRFIKFGIKGQADISGILRGGRRLEIEVKTPTGRQTTEQKAFQWMIQRFGGLYILARSVNDVIEQLGEYLHDNEKTAGTSTETT